MSNGAEMEEPNVEWSRDQFFELAMHPDFPDEMVYQVNRTFVETEPNVTFSEEAIDDLAEQFRTFLMARILGRYKKTGKMPLKLRASVVLDWNPGDPVIDPDVGPFYRINSDEGLTPFDGSRRKWGRD